MRRTITINAIGLIIAGLLGLLLVGTVFSFLYYQRTIDGLHQRVLHHEAESESYLQKLLVLERHLGIGGGIQHYLLYLNHGGEEHFLNARKSLSMALDVVEDFHVLGLEEEQVEQVDRVQQTIIGMVEALEAVLYARRGGTFSPAMTIPYQMLGLKMAEMLQHYQAEIRGIHDAHLEELIRGINRDKINVLRLSTAIILLVAGLIILVVWLLWARVIRPTKTLNEYMLNLKENKPITHMPYHVDDEFGSLFRSFRELTQTIQGKERQLLESKDKMEIRVAERTEELEYQRLYLNTILNNLAEAIIIIDAGGKMQMFSSRAEEMFGHRQADVLGKNVSILMPRSHAEKHDGYMNRYMQTGEARIIGVGRKLKAVRRDGSEFSIMLSVTQIDYFGETLFVGAIRDITDEEEQSIMMEEQQKQLKALDENIPGMIFRMERSLQGKYKLLTVSESIRELTGIPKELALRDMDAVFATIHPDDLERVRLSLEAAAKVGMNWSESFRHIVSERGIIWVSAKAATEKKEDGSVIWSGVVVEITEQIEAEEKLKLINERFKLSLEGTRDGIWDWDLKTNQVFFSDNWFSMLGYPPNAMPGTIETFRELVHPEDAPKVQGALDKHFKDSRQDYEIIFRMRAQDGRYVQILSRGRALRDRFGKPYRMIGGHADISLLLKAQQDALRFKALVEETDEMIFLADLETLKPFYINRAGEELLGILNKPQFFQEGLPMHKPIDMVSQFRDEIIPSVVELGSWEGETRFINLKTRKEWVAHQRIFRVLDLETQRPLCFASIVRDITEDKMSADELRRHRDDLEVMVQEKAADLVQAKDRAEKALDEANRANNLKTEFLANMSHELRTPMHAILSFSDLGLRKLEKGDEEKLPRYLEQINTSGKRLLDLLNNLLDLSKLESNGVMLQLAICNLGGIINQSQVELQPLLDQKSITLTVDEAPFESLSLAADKAKLIQVLINVLSNAIKFSPEGSAIEISMTMLQEAIPEQALIHVRDYGVGIPPGERETIFDKFAQSSNTRTGAGGTGLGLPISREIMRLHGGDIYVTDVDGKGSCFVIAVPVSTDTNFPRPFVRTLNPGSER